MAGFESVSLPNQLIWNFMFWTDVHRTIEYFMMMTGHTKFEPDWHFGIWKMHWRDSNVEIITEVKLYSSFNLGWFGCFIVFSTTFNNIKSLMMFFKTRWRFSVISHRRAKPLRWEMTEKRPRVLKTSLIILSLC